MIVAVHARTQIQSQNTGTSLTFHISGFTDNSGKVLVQLFRKEDKVPAKPFRVVEGKIDGQKAEVVVADLPYGEYAAIIVHDQNSNGHIDHKWGIPAEPLGYPNHWKLSLFSGMPSFDKLKFVFSPSTNNCDIVMNE